MDKKQLKLELDMIMEIRKLLKLNQLELIENPILLKFNHIQFHQMLSNVMIACLQVLELKI